MTPEQVSRLVTDVLGETPSTVTRMTFGHSSVSYDVVLAERSLIVRTNTDPSVFAKTSANLITLRKLGLPVPKVLTSDLTQASCPSAYMILEKIPGRDLRDELGLDGVLAEINCGSLIPHARVMRALKLLCAEVMPAFR